jgi:hypothetical protein
VPCGALTEPCFQRHILSHRRERCHHHPPTPCLRTNGKHGEVVLAAPRPVKPGLRRALASRAPLPSRMAVHVACHRPAAQPHVGGSPSQRAATTVCDNHPGIGRASGEAHSLAQFSTITCADNWGAVRDRRPSRRGRGQHGWYEIATCHARDGQPPPAQNRRKLSTPDDNTRKGLFSLPRERLISLPCIRAAPSLIVTYDHRRSMARGSSARRPATAMIPVTGPGNLQPPLVQHLPVCDSAKRWRPPPHWHLRHALPGMGPDENIRPFFARQAVSAQPKSLRGARWFVSHTDAPADP